jgi:hydroxymethylglutaryl-CoA reductase (NADPH)
MESVIPLFYGAAFWCAESARTDMAEHRVNNEADERRLSEGTVKPSTLNPNPKSPIPKPQSPNPKPQTPNPKPQTPNPKPQTPTYSLTPILTTPEPWASRLPLCRRPTHTDALALTLVLTHTQPNHSLTHSLSLTHALALAL